MALSMYHVNAFTDQPFAGNPAAVCPLAEWPDDKFLRAVAAENNLSETAYFVPEEDGFHLRWFTPVCEVNLCGHATLASAFVLINVLGEQREAIRFYTRSGILSVRREEGFLLMDFPALRTWKCEIPPKELLQGLGIVNSAKISVVQLKDNFFGVFEDEETVRQLQPDLRLLEKLHPAGVAITARGSDCDFVSRYFAPSYGIPEDPVTGSTHCSLAPYWAEQLGKTTLHARQVSERGGELWCEVAGDRVILKGKAVLTLKGSLQI